MANSTYGNYFSITTYGESHGAGVGVVVDGCPSGLTITREEIQSYLNRRRPGQSSFSTPRNEKDQVEILSGIFNDKTTGAPIGLLVRNENQHSKDYDELATIYRPGHADFSWEQKFGIRDYRGGGRSSGRETIGRVAGGAIALTILAELGIHVTSYVRAIGPIHLSSEEIHLEERDTNPLFMPNQEQAKHAQDFLKECMKNNDSVGCLVECVITGCHPGLGEPVFDKLDARLAQAILSIGAVKGIEFGDGFLSAKQTGSLHNDAFTKDATGRIHPKTNHDGGVLGGISNGNPIVFRAAIKPTPSIRTKQTTVNQKGELTSVSIAGRHDPIIGPRAVVVVEAMAGITLVDLLFSEMSSQMDSIKRFYHQK